MVAWRDGSTTMLDERRSMPSEERHAVTYRRILVLTYHGIEFCAAPMAGL
jgi:hypothetical protein